MRHTSRPYISLAIALICPVTLVQLLFPDRPTVLENWNPKMVISVQYGMFIVFTIVFQALAAIYFDFRMFTRVPVAFSYLRSVSANAGMSFGSVTNSYVICIHTTALRVPLLILIPVIIRSKRRSKGFRHKQITTYSTDSLVVPHIVWERETWYVH